MKKIITCVIAVLLLSLAVFPTSVTAAEKDAIKSPVLSDGTVTVEDGDDKAQVEIIHYSEREQLSEDDRAIFEAAYKALYTNYGDLSKVNDSFTQKAGELCLGIDELAISNYFAVRVNSEDASGCNVVLSTELMPEYVALLRYEDSQWKRVDNVTWSADGKTLTFTAKGTYPYAVAVEAAKKDESTLAVKESDAPEMTYASDDKTVYLTITPYKDKATLSRPKERALEQCYRMIRSSDSVTELNTELKDIAEDHGFETEDLHVTQLFDISASEEKGIRFVIQLTTDAKDFASLLHFKNGVWVVVEDITVNYEDNSISFETADFSPFAIVSNVETSQGRLRLPCRLWLLLLLLLILIICLILILLYLKRRNRKKEEK